MREVWHRSQLASPFWTRKWSRVRYRTAKVDKFNEVFLCVDLWVGINNKALKQVVGTDRKPVVRGDLFQIAIFVRNM